jgi:hypothetical protein
VCNIFLTKFYLHLKSLGLDINSLNPKHIDKLSFSLVSGKSIDTALPLGGFGVSRYELDKYLYKSDRLYNCSRDVSDVDFFKVHLQLSQI